MYFLDLFVHTKNDLMRFSFCSVAMRSMPVQKMVVFMGLEINFSRLVTIYLCCGTIELFLLSKQFFLSFKRHITYLLIPKNHCNEVMSMSNVCSCVHYHH